MGRGTSIGSIYRSAFSGVFCWFVSSSGRGRGEYQGWQNSSRGHFGSNWDRTVWLSGYQGVIRAALRVPGGKPWRLGVAVYEDAATAKTKARGLTLTFEAYNRMVSNMTCAEMPSRKIRF
ncbi:hypothetical protein M434DRAFT_36784 [Hypoxylon sp. CO27-5]|nr:hypothetical protein M434DRAFT_36784 [Hypoxylon sp. CO27-5]